MKKRLAYAAGIAAIFLTVGLQSCSTTEAARLDEYFKIVNGELERPTGYREWIYVGTPVTPNDLNDGKAAFPEFHNVYIDPTSWAHWKDTGEFRDGTILIKELVSVGAKSFGNAVATGVKDEWSGVEKL